jgi:hypothetical protein
MKHHYKKRIFAAIILLILMLTYAMPFTSFAAEGIGRIADDPPEEPLEKPVLKQGSWSTEYMNFDDKDNLIISYTGSRSIEKDPIAVDGAVSEEWRDIAQFKLKTKTLLRGVYVPYTYPADQVPAENSRFYLADDRGNIYGPFSFQPVKVLRAKDVYETQKAAEEEGVMVSMDPDAAALELPDRLELDNVFIAGSQIVLAEGKYTLYVTNGNGVVSNATNEYKASVFIKGIEYSAWKKYRAEYLQWEQEQAGIETYSGSGDEMTEGDVVISVDGSQDLSDAAAEPDQDYQILISVAPAEAVPASFTIKESSVIEEIVFNTMNGGSGAVPGTISILDEKGQVAGSFQASGGTLGGVANGLWRVGPEIVLPAGTYQIVCSDPSAVGYLADGTPDFYVAVAPAPPAMFDFTGRYFIDASVMKTSTLMGPVSGGAPSFTLTDFELTVLDRGDSLELIGRYEGIPFSQVCTITSREPNQLTATFNFAADLTKLPYKAKIGAACAVTLIKTPGNTPSIDIKGTATYDRKASKNKGADFNTYDVAAKGNQADTVLPAYVAAALAARVPGAGNIPGPANSTQAAAGALFPPLVGLVVQVIQSMIKKREEEVEEAEHGPKKPKHTLSVGEQAMADANNSLGKGLYDEKEAKAWATLADALGNSDEPDDDPFSVGDNERPGGSDYNAPQGDGESGGYDGSEDAGQDDYSGPEEDNTFGKPDVPPENPSEAPGTEQTPGSEQTSGAEAQPGAESQPPQTMTVQVDHTGRTAEIQFDPKRGTWVNTESGNDFDMDKYVRDVAPSFGKDKAFTDEQRIKLEKGDTAMDHALDQIKKERDEKLASIQKEINDRTKEEIRIQTEKAVKEAEESGSYIQILKDTLKNIGNDLSDTKKTLAEGASAVINETVKAGKEIWNDPSILVNTASGTLKDIRDALAGTIKDASQAASDIYHNPEILTGTLTGSYETVKGGLKSAGKEIINTVKDPNKAWDFVKETTGLTNFGNAMDPNLTLIDRIKQIGVGTVKLGTTIATAGEATAIVKSGAGKLGGFIDDVVGIGGKKAAGTGGTAAESILSGKVVKPNAGGKVVSGENYITTGKAPNLNGVTEKSQIAIQNVADKHAVQIHTRPTTEQAADWLKSGKAVAKDCDMKAKTLDKIDELIGGPQGREGVVGYFKPNKPPESIMKTLDPKLQADIEKRFTQRLDEFEKLKKDMGVVGDKPPWTSANGRYSVDNYGVVHDMTNQGKMVTGDVDIFDITSFDGKPLPENVKQMVWKELKTVSPSNVKHGNLTSWDATDHAFDADAKIKMINDARAGGKGVNSFNPNAAPTHSYQNGPQLVNVRDQVQQLAASGKK